MSEISLSSPADAVGSAPVLEAVNLTKHFPLRAGGRLTGRKGRRVVHAVDDVSLSLYAGRVTALVGESGSGKSTLARLLAQLHAPSSGQLLFQGRTVQATRGRAFRDYTSDVQLILQDPFGSFNPVLTIARHLQRTVRIHEPGLKKVGFDRRIAEIFGQVNLDPPQQFVEKYPHELSGGQLQRASIARALAARPSVLLADEPVSNLDVSIRLGILNLLAQLTTDNDVALLYVTHDIASARYFASETAVMYAGELIEGGSSEDVTQQAAHPYTQLLIASAPDPNRAAGTQRVKDIGAPPSLIDPPSGCRFHPRCPFATQRCETSAPPRFELADGHWTRCWLYGDRAVPDATPLRIQR